MPSTNEKLTMCTRCGNIQLPAQVCAKCGSPISKNPYQTLETPLPSEETYDQENRDSQLHSSEDNSHIPMERGSPTEDRPAVGVSENADMPELQVQDSPDDTLSVSSDIAPVKKTSLAFLQNIVRRRGIRRPKEDSNLDNVLITDDRSSKKTRKMPRIKLPFSKAYLVAGIIALVIAGVLSGAFYMYSSALQKTEAQFHAASREIDGLKSFSYAELESMKKKYIDYVRYAKSLMNSGLWNDNERYYFFDETRSRLETIEKKIFCVKTLSARDTRGDLLDFLFEDNSFALRNEKTSKILIELSIPKPGLTYSLDLANEMNPCPARTAARVAPERKQNEQVKPSDSVSQSGSQHQAIPEQQSPSKEHGGSPPLVRTDAERIAGIFLDSIKKHYESTKEIATSTKYIYDRYFLRGDKENAPAVEKYLVEKALFAKTTGNRITIVVEKERSTGKERVSKWIVLSGPIEGNITPRVVESPTDKPPL